MAGACLPKSDKFEEICAISRDPELTKQDCTSPSPTETVCIVDSICGENIPGTSQRKLDEAPDFCDKIDLIDENVKKTCFLNKLGLIEEYDEDETSREDNWEDCIDNVLDEINNDDENSCENDESVNIFHTVTPRSSSVNRNNSDSSERNLRKRKLDVNNGFPNKKNISEERSELGSPLLNNENTPGGTSSFRSGSSSTFGSRTRSLIPTKDNPPPEMPNWLLQFSKWSNAERIMAISELIARCEPTQVRHMMQVIEPQFQRDFISLLPKELALKVLSFLEPKDLLKAAQTCHSWRVLAEDNLLWKEKCKEAGIDEIPRRRYPPRSPRTNMSPWKTAFMRQHAIETNWRSKPIRPPKMLKGHDDHVITCLQFSDNKIVSGSDDNTLKVWSAVSGKCLRTLVGHTGGVWSSQMSGNTIISGSTDRTLKVWDADTGVCRHTLYGHTSTVRCMHLHGNKVVSG